MVSIRVQEVSKYFESTPALQNVTLEISPGEIFFLLGPSGCGKTTLLRTLAGFVFPDQGEVFFNDKAVTRVPPHLRKVGMVFQNYALWPHLSVNKNVSFGLEQLGGISSAEKKERVNEILRMMRLEGLAKRGISELSGGQQQRVALARALVVHPPCLLLDEPLANLDSQLRIQMRSELRSLCQQQHITTIYVTHDQKEALATADRIAVMANGNIRQIGTPQEIYRQPIDSFVASFIGEANLFPGRVMEFLGKNIVVETELGQLLSEVPPHSTPQWSIGESCKVCIRPEALKILAPNSPHSFSAQIETSVFLGEAVEYHVSTKVGPLKILAYAPSGTPQSGAISLTVAPHNVILLKN